MDKRVLQTGLIRLRFKLHQKAHMVITHAVSLVGCKYPHTALETICLDFLVGTTTTTTTTTTTKKSAVGTSRFLVRLYPEQYEVFQLAMDEAKNRGQCEEDALFHICKNFINQYPSCIKSLV